jgi:hypothetical protein
MKLRSAKASLSIGRIADEWAKEIAGQPGTLSRDEIFRELTRVYWSGAFDKSADGGRPSPTLRFNHNAPTEMFGESRADEDQTQRKDPPAGAPDLTSTGLHEATRTLVSVLMCSIESGAAADIADEKRRLLERIEIPRISFREWLVGAGHDLPRFWFGSTEIAAHEPPTSVKVVRPQRPRNRKKVEESRGPTASECGAYWIKCDSSVPITSINLSQRPMRTLGAHSSETTQMVRADSQGEVPFRTH